MSKVDIIFLHGFLGAVSDWDDIIENVKVDLEEQETEAIFYAVDYFNRPNMSPKNSFDKMATEFVNWVTSSTSNQKKILVGYSLGGRLGLHIFEKSPNLFHRLLCISCHPGYKQSQQEEIQERDSRDQFWAELFLHHNWPELIQKWNEQDVFAGSDFEPERDVADYRRDQLAKAMVNWSLAKQQDKRELLKNFSSKITWVIGEKDKKFVELTKNLVKEIPSLEVEFIPMAGHRVLFDNSFDLARSISNKVIQTP